MGPGERLNREQLEDLEGLLVGQGAPVVQRLQPPASKEAIDILETALGLSLPDELKLWWRWHNGTAVEPHEPPAHGLIGPFFQFLDTARALRFSQDMRKMALEDVPEEPDATWAPNWLAISSNGPVACDVGVPNGAPVPILDVDYHHTDVPGRVSAQSFGQMVRWWIEALEAGAWIYEPERQWWERREELVPPERERAGLV
jgi:cell wall assembly regulator SMI1